MTENDFSKSPTPPEQNPKQSPDSGDITNPPCILERIASLQSLAESFFESVPESQSSQHHFRIKLEAVNRDIQQTFEQLKQVISNIHDGRSQWESQHVGLIQRTGEQLHKVTQTTENATHQILDAIEKVIASQANNSQQVSELLAAMENGSDAVSSPDIHGTLKDLASDIETEQADTFRIMDYLQFQDITAQQIEQAYQLLGEVEEKLIRVVQTFKSLDPKDLEDTRMAAKMHDPEAEYSPTEEKQKQIDALFER